MDNKENDKKNQYKKKWLPLIPTIIIIVTVVLVVIRLIINSLYTCEIVPGGLLFCDMPEWLQHIEIIIHLLEYVLIPASIFGVLAILIYADGSKKQKNMKH